jgi:WD40 repeat protein
MSSSNLIPRRTTATPGTTLPRSFNERLGDFNRPLPGKMHSVHFSLDPLLTFVHNTMTEWCGDWCAEPLRIEDRSQNLPPQIIPITHETTQAIAVSADSQIVAMGAEDGSVSLLHMKRPEIRLAALGIFNGQPDQGFGFPKTLFSLPNSGLTFVGHSGGWFATVDQKTMTAREAFSGCRGAINSIAAHPEKPIVAVGNGGEDQSVILLTFSPDYWFCQNTSGLIRSSPTPLARIRTEADVRQLAFSRTGDRLIVALRNGDVVTYDAVTCQITSRVKCHEGGIYAMDVYEDLLITGGHDGFVRIANLNNRTQLSRWKAHDNRITCMAVSQDGNSIYTGTHDGDICLWNRDGRKIPSLLAHVGSVLCLELSVDGETLFTGGHDRRILLWDALTGDLQREVAAHTDRVMDVDFLSEEAGLLSSSFDGMLHHWGYRSDSGVSIGTPQ